MHCVSPALAYYGYCRRKASSSDLLTMSCGLQISKFIIQANSLLLSTVLPFPWHRFCKKLLVFCPIHYTPCSATFFLPSDLNHCLPIPLHLIYSIALFIAQSLMSAPHSMYRRPQLYRTRRGLQNSSMYR